MPFGAALALPQVDFIRVDKGLPNASESIIQGSGLSFFTYGRPAEIFISPRVINGMPAKFVKASDIVLFATDMRDGDPAPAVRVEITHTDADPFSWRLLYTVDDESIYSMKLDVVVYGVSMLPPGGVIVNTNFNYKTALLQSQYELMRGPPFYCPERTMAVNKAGTNIVTKMDLGAITVYSLCVESRELRHMHTIRAGANTFTQVKDICFSDANTLLIIDIRELHSHFLCHLALDGFQIEPPVLLTENSWYIAVHGDIVAICGGTHSLPSTATVCLRSLSSVGTILRSWRTGVTIKQE